MTSTNHRPSGSAPRQRRLRSLWANLALTLGSLVLGLIALELALGLTAYRYLTQPGTDYPSGYFINDPDLGVDIAPNQSPATFRMRGPAHEVFSNQWGCFDHDDPVGEGYVLAVGDSSTWGYAPLEDKWTSHLEIRSGHRVLKCGVSGTGPRYQQIKADKTIAQVGVSPDVILVLYDTWNDLNDDVVFPGYGVVEGYRGHTMKSLDLRDGTLVRHTPEAFEQKYRRYVKRREAFDLARFLVRHLTTAAMISHAIDSFGRETVTERIALQRRYDVSLWRWVDRDRGAWLDHAIDDHLENIRRLRRTADEHGAALVLITDGIGDTGLHGRFSAFLASEIPYHLDVAGPMAMAAQGQPTRYRFDEHWNPLGNRLAAEIIHRYLAEQGLL